MTVHYTNPEWNLCVPDDLQYNDGYKVVGDNWEYEAEVVYLDSDIICYHPGTGAQITRGNIDTFINVRLYRKSKPVPLPTETHSTITNVIVAMEDNETMFCPVLLRTRHNQWMGVDAWGNQCTRIDDSQIISWEKGKVVRG